MQLLTALSVYSLQAADAIERARRMAMNIGRRRIPGLNASLAATPGVIVYPPRPLLAPTFPAIQTKLNLALQQQMIVARTQQIQRHIASAQDRAKKEAAAKAEMMAEIMSLRNS